MLVVASRLDYDDGLRDDYGDSLTITGLRDYGDSLLNAFNCLIPMP